MMFNECKHYDRDIAGNNQCGKNRQIDMLKTSKHEGASVVECYFET